MRVVGVMLQEGSQAMPDGGSELHANTPTRGSIRLGLHARACSDKDHACIRACMRPQSALGKICRDTSKLAAEQIKGLSSQVCFACAPFVTALPCLPVLRDIDGSRCKELVGRQRTS